MNHFFDVGANIGQTFRDYLNPHPEFDGWEVWCFEPSPRHLSELMRTAEEESARYKVHVCPFGLRGTTSTHEFFMKDDARGDSFEEYLQSDHVTENVINGYTLHACAVCIGAFILDHTQHEDQIVLKLDCEGSEYDILSSLLYEQAALRRIQSILVEWHTIKSVPVYSKDALISFFEKAGKPLQQWQF